MLIRNKLLFSIGNTYRGLYQVQAFESEALKEITAFVLDICVILYVLSVVFNLVKAQTSYTSRVSYNYFEAVQHIITVSLLLGLAFVVNKMGPDEIIGSTPNAEANNIGLWQSMAKTVVAVVVGTGTMYIFINAAWLIGKAQMASKQHSARSLSDTLLQLFVLLAGAVFTIMSAVIAGGLVDGVKKLAGG